MTISFRPQEHVGSRFHNCSPFQDCSTKWSTQNQNDMQIYHIDTHISKMRWKKVTTFDDIVKSWAEIACVGLIPSWISSAASHQTLLEESQGPPWDWPSRKCFSFFPCAVSYSLTISNRCAFNLSVRMLMSVFSLVPLPLIALRIASASPDG